MGPEPHEAKLIPVEAPASSGSSGQLEELWQFAKGRGYGDEFRFLFSAAVAPENQADHPVGLSGGGAQCATRGQGARYDAAGRVEAAEGNGRCVGSPALRVFCLWVCVVFLW